MFLKHLVIRRKDTWEDKTRPLVGTVWFENDDGTEVKINVDESASTRIVELCADGIVAAGREVAQLLKDDLNRMRLIDQKTP